MWLDRVGSERIDETIDPELTIERDNRGVKLGIEYAILTDEITKAWAGLNTRQYKHLKVLKKGKSRDNMSTLELVLNMLAEATSTELSKNVEPKSFNENREVAIKGGSIAGNSHKEIESTTGKPVLTENNAIDFTKVIADIISDEQDDDK